MVLIALMRINFTEVFDSCLLPSGPPAGGFPVSRLLSLDWSSVFQVSYDPCR